MKPHNHRSLTVKDQVLHRLKIASGHLAKVIRMVERDDYCIDIIHQSMAVQAALRTTDQHILKNHMEMCVADAIKRGKTKEVIDEVMKVVEKQ